MGGSVVASILGTLVTLPKVVFVLLVLVVVWLLVSSAATVPFWGRGGRVGMG